jgi:hypothetical protein
MYRPFEMESRNGVVLNRKGGAEYSTERAPHASSATTPSGGSHGRKARASTPERTIRASATRSP